MNRNHYHEIYGFMPKSIVSHLSVYDKTTLIGLALTRETTPAGNFMMLATITALGEPFINYMVDSLTEAIIAEGGTLTRDEITNIIKDEITGFAADPNTLMEYVNDYVEETGNPLELNWDKLDYLSKSIKEENESKPAEEEKPTYTRDSKGRLRDSKGHFVKE